MGNNNVFTIKNSQIVFTVNGNNNRFDVRGSNLSFSVNGNNNQLQAQASTINTGFNGNNNAFAVAEDCRLDVRYDNGVNNRTGQPQQRQPQQ